jgi:hypothetical protein
MWSDLDVDLSGGDSAISLDHGSALIAATDLTLTAGQVSAMNSELAAGGFLDIFTLSGAAAINNSRLQSIKQDILVDAATTTTVKATVLTAGFSMDVGASGAAQVQTSRFTGKEVNIFSDASTTTANLNNFMGVKGPVGISGASGCTSTQNVPNTPCS